MKRHTLALLFGLMLLLAACGGGNAETNDAGAGAEGAASSGSGSGAQASQVTPDLQNRPRTGIFVKKKGGGRGVLVINNNAAQDAAVYLITSDGELAQAGFVRSEESLKLSSFKDGDYTMNVIAGQAWDMGVMNFTVEPTYYQFADTVTFTEDAREVEVTIDDASAGSGQALTFDDFPALR